MIARLLVGGLIVATTACGGSPFSAVNGSEDLVLRSGTSFGECIGYCRHEIEIDPTEIVVTESSWSPGQLPTRVTRATITPAEWSELVELVGQYDLRGLEEVYGCPDCADGGAEWIEVQKGDVTRRVAFQYGASDVPRVQPLVERLREIRVRYDQPDQ